MSQPDTHFTTMFEELARESVLADATFKRQLVITLQDVQHPPPDSDSWWQTLRALWQTPQSWQRRSWRGGLAMMMAVAVTWALLLNPAQRAVLTVVQGPIHVTGDSGLLAPWRGGRQAHRVDEQRTISVKTGSNIVLSEQSAAVLDLFNGSQVELSAGTQMTLTQASPGSLWQAPNVQLQVQTGEVRAHVNKLKGPQERFEITLPSVQISVRGTVFRARVISDTHTYVATDEGMVMVTLFGPALSAITIDVPAGYEVHAIVGLPLHLQRQSADDIAMYAVTPTIAIAPASSRTPLPAPLVDAMDVVSAMEIPDMMITRRPTLEPHLTVTPIATPPPILSPTSSPSTMLSSRPTVSETSSLAEPGEDADETSVTPPVVIIQRADIAVSQHDTPDPTAADSQLTYIVEIINHGAVPAEHVIVTNTLPAQVKLITATHLVSSSQPLVWDLGTLAPNERRVLLIQTHVHSDVVRALHNMVQVHTRSLDADLSNNRSIEFTAVTQATDLALTTIQIPTQIGAGETFTGVLEYDNFGPAHAEAVTLALHLPPEIHFGGTVTTTPALTFIPAGPADVPGTLLIAKPRPVGWAATTMPAFSTGRVVFTLTATANMTGPVAYTSYITSTTTDTHIRNNSKQRNLTILPTANVAITVASTPTTVINGGSITYTLHYINHGPWAAENVFITHASSLGLHPYVLDDWLIPLLPSGASGSVVLTATVTATTSHPVTYTATLQSATLDPHIENNQHRVTTPVQIASLALHSAITPQRIVPNMPFTYTITLTNTGVVTIPAQTLVLRGTLPADIVYRSADTAVSLSDPQRVPWRNSTALAPGNGLTLTLVPSSTALTLGHYRHLLVATARFSSVDVRVTDVTSVQVVAPSIAVKTIVHSVSDVTIPHFITLTTYLTNTGPSPVAIVPMRVVLTYADLQFVSATPFPNVIHNDGELVWRNTLTSTASALPRILRLNTCQQVTSTFYFSPTLQLATTTPLLYEVYVHNAMDVYQNYVDDMKLRYLDLHQLHLPLIIIHH